MLCISCFLKSCTCMHVCVGLGSLNHTHTKLIELLLLTDTQNLLRKVYMRCIYPHARRMSPS